MLHHVWFGVQLALAWFFALNVITAAAVRLAGRPIRRLAGRSRAPWAPLAWRLLPAAVSIVVTCGLAVPAYAWLEPRNTGESLGWLVRVLSAAGMALIAASIVRGAMLARGHSRALRAAVAARAPLPGFRLAVPAFVVRTTAPFLLLAGVCRPRLYVSERVVDVLTNEELHVAVAHELAHHRAADNLKRAVLAFLPDLLAGTSLGENLERRWRFSAECAADAAVARTGAPAAVALASALVKVARLQGGAQPRDFGCAAFDHGAPIAERVRRLVSQPSEDGLGARWAVRVLASVAALLSVMTAAWLSHALLFTHRLSELAVRLP